MDRNESAAHHDTYEYAIAQLKDLSHSDDGHDKVIVDRGALLSLCACYAHLYNDVYINKRIEPYKSFIKKVDTH